MNRQRWRGWLLVAIQAALLAILIFSPSQNHWPVPQWLRTAGNVLRLIGAAAILFGALKLGRAASVHPEPTAKAVLRTDGLYGHVRHPIYTGVMALAAGIAATSGSLVAAGAFLALIALFSVKARFEEQLLAERFDGYRRYSSVTPQFFPSFIGRQRSGKQMLHRGRVNQ